MLHIGSKFKRKPGAAHFICFSGPGSQVVRHSVQVPKGPQRFAFVLRSISAERRMLLARSDGLPYERLIHKCQSALHSVWQTLTEQIQTGHLTRDSPAMRALGPPDPLLGPYTGPIESHRYCLGLAGNTPYVGGGGPCSEFSPQPQVLSRIRMHVAAPGNSIALVAANGSSALASVVLDFTNFQLQGLVVTSVGPYPDQLQLVNGGTLVLSAVMHAPAGPGHHSCLKAASLSESLDLPVRVLIKHCPTKALRCSPLS